MNKHAMTGGLLALGLLVAGPTALAQKSAADLGKREFNSNCANCHAESGKGGGPFTEWLKRSPPDLTILAKNNGGVFPLTRIYQVIEGAGPGHGTRDMPIWGRAYRIDAAEHFVDVPYNQEAFVRGRILALAEYLNQLQVK